MQLKIVLILPEVFSQFDIEMTRRSLELAAQGIGLVSPNPLVGCVIISPDGEIVGEGSYIYENITHAEALALNQAGERAKGATAYVSLEPHSHQNRTPPCTDALINAGIKRVICPIEDPNPMVAGRGFQALREKGIEVVTGILAEEAIKQNEKFICWHRKKRPFIHLKMALSLDGRISSGRSISTALTGKESSERVHALRHEYDAILIGGNTAFIDNPNLTDRSGKPRGKKLIRIILDNSLKISLDSILATTAMETPTLIFTNSMDEEKAGLLRTKGAEVENIDAHDLNAVIEELRKREIQSVLIEGGGEIAGSFKDSGLIDKVSFIFAPLLIGGSEAPISIKGKGPRDITEALKLKDIQTARHGSDIEITGYPA